MPIPPPAVTIPFDTVDVAMNMARVKLNDCPLALSGNLLANTQPYAQQIANDGWRAMQEDLADAGEPVLTSEVVIRNLPPVATTDPGVYCYLNQAEYCDGVAVWQPPVIAVLPQNFMIPLWCRERLAGTNGLFIKMRPVDDGLPGGPKTTTLKWWEWRSGNDLQIAAMTGSIWLQGATTSRDLWVRYISYMPDFETVGSIQWYQQPITIMRSAPCLAFYIAAEFAFARGSDQAVAVGNSFLAQGKDALRRLSNRQLKPRQRINHRRRSYASGRHQGWGFW